MENRNSGSHFFQKFSGHRFIHGYHIFLFMLISCTHDTIYQISLIRHKKQPLGFLIKAPHRVDSQRIVQIVCHRGFVSLLLCAADDPSGFVKQKQNSSLFLYCPFSIHINFFAVHHPVSRTYHSSIHGNTP